MLTWASGKALWIHSIDAFISSARTSPVALEGS
jgi:hypothetical protein